FNNLAKIKNYFIFLSDNSDLKYEFEYVNQNKTNTSRQSSRLPRQYDSTSSSTTIALFIHSIIKTRSSQA
ncbi:MAG TPA: hypothetical protein PLA77_07625, partial [Bacteroidales bacterium]|nr:hypothetical protein [Bacteroidales bacterium]